MLNEGAVIIKRQNHTQPDTSDEEEEETQQEIKEPEEPEPPPRDPLEVEEEALNEKLQTAGFFLSMPEEEQIKKRLLEIKQIRENPDWLNPENTKVKNMACRSIVIISHVFLEFQVQQSLWRNCQT